MPKLPYHKLVGGSRQWMERVHGADAVFVGLPACRWVGWVGALPRERRPQRPGLPLQDPGRVVLVEDEEPNAPPQIAVRDVVGQDVVALQR